MTMNVAGQDWMGFPHREKPAGEIFRKQNADIVGFQEIGLANWDNVFGPARPDLVLAKGREAGDIVINSFAYRPARFALLMYDTFWLSPNCTYMKAWDGAERGVTWGHLKDRETGREFVFINAYLDNKGVIARRESVRLIVEFVEQLGAMPIILVGDLNMSVDSPHIELWGRPEMREPYDELLQARFVDVWPETHAGDKRPCMYHKFKGHEYEVFKDDEYGTYDTDYIMTRGPLKAVSSRLVTEKFANKFPSDHFWMEATIGWV